MAPVLDSSKSKEPAPLDTMTTLDPAPSSPASATVVAEHGRWNPRSPVVYGYVRAEDERKDNVMRPSE